MANFNLENYVPVHERIEKFYQAHTNGRIVTQIEQHEESGLVIFKAAVFRNQDDAEPSATGHAYEQNGSNYINKTSYIENCETSAIGRALANLGIEVSRGIASREEMQKVERMQKQPEPEPPPPTGRDAALAELRATFKALSAIEQGWTKEALDAFIGHEDRFPGLTVDLANEAQLKTVNRDLIKYMATIKPAKAAKGGVK